MAMKNGTKLEEELTCQFKIDMMNLTNFDSSTQKSPKMVLKNDAKCERKLTCASKNEMSDLANFHQGTRKSQNREVIVS